VEFQHGGFPSFGVRREACYRGGAPRCVLRVEVRLWIHTQVEGVFIVPIGGRLREM
jgi:hypothetical protein